MTARRAESAGEAARPSVVRGAGYGAAAFVLGYVLTFALVALDASEGVDDLPSELPGVNVSLVDVVGWVFYNAHFVDVELTSFGRTEPVNFLSEVETETVPEVAFYAVPIVLVLAAGYRLGSTVDVGSTRAAVAAGASVVAGYLPLVLVGTVVFSGTAETDPVLGQTLSVAYDVEASSALVLAGIVYPVVLGAVGGYVGNS